ncbi:MAG TPA: basic amino acid ABC transporter substrate-binding protein [Firmicutes bacterium]|nr:basic amino acid ABC transporter substrate-binding protein [Candidatus Fermentithermobacillaceae bacterium]
MKKTFTLVVLSLVLISAVFVGGCAQKTANPPAQTKTDAPKRKLVAVGECTFAPFEFIDEKTGKPAGFDVELIQAIAEASGFEVEYKNLDWNSLIPALNNKEADLVVSGMTITDERALQVTFSDPYFTSGQAWAVKEGSPIKTISDLAGKTVAVQNNTTGDYAAQKLDARFKEEKKPGLIIKRFDNAADVFNELKAGGVDAIISDLPVIREYLKNHPEDKLIIPEPAFTVEYYGIAMRKQDKDIHELINKGLAKIKASGKHDEIYQKYFGKK